MAAVTDVTIAATSTSILTAAIGWGYSGPLYLKNESNEVITLTIAGSDDYELDPGEALSVIPGQVITGTAVGGAAKLQVIQGVIPADESVAKSGGAVTASGSAAAAGNALWSVGQDDFTAVYASATTLTMGAFPAAMGTPVSGDFAVVIVTDVNGLQTPYVPTRNPMNLSGSTLTVAGASFAVSDLHYDVFVWGPPKGFSSAENAWQTYLLNPAWSRRQSPVRTASSQGDGTTTYEYDMLGYKFAGLSIQDTAGGAGDQTYTVEASWADDASYYVDMTQDWFGVASVTSAAIAASASAGVLEVDTPKAARWIKLKVVRANDGGATDGGWTVHLQAIY